MRTTAYSSYIHEILGHYGLCYETVAWDDLPERLSRLRLLVTVGEHRFPDSLKTALTEWVTQGGGAWLSIGGLCGMGELLGADYEPAAYIGWGGTGALRTLGEGYLEPEQSSGGHPALGVLPLPLHFFGGVSAMAQGATVLASVLDSHHRPTSRPAVLEREAGVGRCLLIAPDVIGSIVRIQQGMPITRDGIPAPDGTGPVADGVLKSDDGQALDWLLDRQPFPDVPGLSGFLHPVADLWSGVLLRSIFHLANQANVSLPLLWLYPHNLPALGHVSHDTDGNDPAKAHLLLETLAKADIHSTWCVILPGYDSEIIDAIRAAGHELATHYDALEHPWSEAEFDRQFGLLREMFGGEQPVTNKNHYLRWQGDTEFFAWCAARGLTMDQSKGASKTGEAGFNFGTCHPYRPVAPDGGILPLWEMATPTQDLEVFAPQGILPPLLDAAARHHGILHLLFHPAHIDKPGVADAIVNAVRAGREQGLEWWTAREISAWEAARRQAVWSEEEGTGPTLTAPTALPGATLLYLAPPGRDLRISGEPADAQSVERWGFRFHAVTRDMMAGESIKIEVVNQ